MVKIFSKPGDFQGLYAAENWLVDNGYSFGSTCIQSPNVAIYKGEYLGSGWKWRHLSMKERSEVHGVMSSRDYRNGEVKIEIKEQYAPPEQK